MNMTVEEFARILRQKLHWLEGFSQALGDEKTRGSLLHEVEDIRRLLNQVVPKEQDQPNQCVRVEGSKQTGKALNRKQYSLGAAPPPGIDGLDGGG